MTKASSGQSLVKFPTGIPCHAPRMAHSCSQLLLALQGPLLPGAHVTGPVMRITAPASAVQARKGLCPPSVPAGTTVAKLVDRIR